MNKVYLLIGGNIGNRLQNLFNARLFISQHCGPLHALSPIYETAAWGNTQQPDFLNQVIELETALAPEDLLNAVLAIEEKMGRQRRQKYDPRTIDIDILLYGQISYHSPTLTIPHPELPRRKFALVPLADLAPGLQHPLTNTTIAQMLAQCTDACEVKKVTGQAD
jgi:2-amino-4-hydroxy-6-hydroxymethyldihydropteridine diphosphokinase